MPLSGKEEGLIWVFQVHASTTTDSNQNLFNAISRLPFSQAS